MTAPSVSVGKGRLKFKPVSAGHARLNTAAEGLYAKFIYKCNVFLSVLVLLWASGCATAPEPSAQLLALQTEYKTLQQQQWVNEYAPETLAQAQESIEMMDALEKTNGDQDEIAHYEYIAKRQLDTAVARAQLKRAQTLQQNAEQQKTQMQVSLAQQQLNANLDAAKAMHAHGEQIFAGKSGIRIEEQTRGLVLVLGAVTFDSGEAGLSNEAEQCLQQVAQFLQAYPQRAVAVEAFTDSTGSAPSNIQLSTKRAQTVVEYLQGQGVASSRMQAWGYGEAHPVASNATVSGRQQNRRLEVVIAYADNTLISSREP